MFQLGNKFSLIIKQFFTCKQRSLGKIVGFLKNCVSRETFLLNKLSLVNATLCHFNNFFSNKATLRNCNSFYFRKFLLQEQVVVKKKLLVLLKNSIKYCNFRGKNYVIFLG